MNIRQLRHFLAAVDHGSLLRASEQVSVSQQGLSKSIRALETHLQAKLFDRGSFGVRLTPYGEALVRRARVICGHSLLAEQDVAALRSGDRGTISIGVGPYFERRVIPEIVSRVSRLRSNVSISLTSGATQRLLDLLQSGEIDFAVSTPSAHFVFPPGVEHEILFSEREQAIVRAGHPLAHFRSIAIRQLIVFPWILSSSAHSERERVSRILQEHGQGWPPRVIYTDSVDTIVDLLKQDDFVHLSAPSLLIHGSSQQWLSSVVIDEIHDKRYGVLAFRRGEQPMPAVSLALSLVRDACREIAQTKSHR